MQKKLNVKGALLDKYKLCNYLETIAADQIIKRKSSKDTYPIPNLKENFAYITETYRLLNEHVALKINIHPAGEWLLDNYYIIEEKVKAIQRELTVKKYCNFPGIDGIEEEGFARIYVLAWVIVAYTEGKIEEESLKLFLAAYQNKKTLSMEEIWSLPLFLEIAIIQKIKEVCEKITLSQIQKYKVESIIERLVEQKEVKNFNKPVKEIRSENMSYPFIEYLSYKLKSYGKKGSPYLQILEEQVEKKESSVSSVIKKEHFDMAVKKVLIGNLIISLKEISKIDFEEIVEELSGVEEILKKDPAEIYDKMDYTSKNMYRAKIKQLASKAKISEVYVAKTLLELAKKEKGRKAHIGYFLLEDINVLYEKLEINTRRASLNEKSRLYAAVNIILPLFISFILINTCGILVGLISYLPIFEITMQTINYILRKNSKTYKTSKARLQQRCAKRSCNIYHNTNNIKKQRKSSPAYEKTRSILPS